MGECIISRIKVDRKQFIAKCKRMKFKVEENMPDPKYYPGYYDNSDILLDGTVKISYAEYDRCIMIIGDCALIKTGDLLQLLRDSKMLAKDG